MNEGNQSQNLKKYRMSASEKRMQTY